MVTFESARERYSTDARFHRLVHILWQELEEARHTHSDIRQAAVLASILHEERRGPEPIIFTKDEAERFRLLIEP